MNYRKKLGIACLLVTAAMAVTGVSNAAAEQSVFCKVNETPCSAGNRYGVGTEFVLKSKGPIKWEGFWEGFKVRTVQCESAEFKGKIVNAGGSTETAEVAFNTQFLGGCGCSIFTLEQAKMKFNWVSGTMNGSALTSGFAYGFTCSGGYCAYGSEIKEGGTLIGGNPASLVFTEAAIPVASGGALLCGKTAKFSGEFEVSTPKPLYVANA